MSHSGGSGKYRAKKYEGLVPMAGAQGGGQRGYRGLSKGEGGSCEVREGVERKQITESFLGRTLACMPVRRGNNGEF